MTTPASSRFVNAAGTSPPVAGPYLSYLGALNAGPSPGRRYTRLSNLAVTTSALGVATVTFPARAIDSATACVINSATTLTIGFASITSIGTTPAGALPVSVVSAGLTVAAPTAAFAAYSVNVEAWYH